MNCICEGSRLPIPYENVTNAWWSEMEQFHPQTIRIPNRGKILFHETSPWCQKGWGPLLWSISEIKEIQNKWRDIPCSLVKGLNIVSKFIYRVNAISVKIPTGFVIIFKFKYLFCHLHQHSPTFLAPGTWFLEDSFPMDRGEGRDGFRMKLFHFRSSGH